MRKYKFKYGIKVKKSIIITITFLAVIIAGLLLMNRRSTRPNIVFIIVDTLRADHTDMGKNGNGNTPALMKLLKNDSVYFGSSYSNAPWTLPSISSMITSKFPSEIGVEKRNSKIDEKFVTLAEILKTNGYSTHGIITHIFLKKKYGLGQGFDTYIEKINSADNNLLTITSPEVTKEAINIIKNNKNRSFFMFLHYFDPHYRYVDHEKKSTYSGPFLPEADEKKKADIIRDNLFSKEDLNYFDECYKSEIRFTDKYIGKVIESLKENNIYKNTLIVFVSDHGEEFGERGALGHGQSLYNELTRIPFILKLPEGYKKKGNIRPVFSNIDIAPTILDAVGIKIPEYFSGTSIFSKKVSETVFMEVNEKKYDTLYNKCAIVNNGWKLIKDFENNKFELYDIKKDRTEKNNRFDSDKKVFFRMYKILKRYIRMTENNRHVSQKTNLTKEEQKKLETLGYIGN